MEHAYDWDKMLEGIAAAPSMEAAVPVPVPGGGSRTRLVRASTDGASIKLDIQSSRREVNYTLMKHPELPEDYAVFRNESALLLRSVSGGGKTFDVAWKRLRALEFPVQTVDF